MKSPKQQLSIEDKMRLAREKAEEKRQKEKREEEAYYTKISTGSSWTIFKIFSFYSLALALLITVETAVDGKTEKITPNNFRFHESIIEIDEAFYIPYYSEITGFIDTSFRVTNSPIFNQAKYVTWTSKYEDTKTPLTYTDYTEWRYNSIYSYYFFIQLVLLIPLFVVWYKRPSPLFKFVRMLCLVLIFPASIYLFFVTIGVFDLLP